MYLSPTLTVAVTETAEFCKAENGSIILTVNSPKPSTVNYIWNGLSNTTSTLTGLKTGIYKVTIQDTLCAIDTTVIIETIDGLIADFEIRMYDTCERTVIFADISSVENGNIVSLNWEIPQLNVTYSGTLFAYTFPDPQIDDPELYIVRLTATTQSGCVHFVEYPITIYPSPKIKIEGNDILCVGDSIYLKAIPVKSKFVKHVWTWQDENNIPQNFTGDSLVIYRQGTYSLMSSNTENCHTADITTVFEAPIPQIVVTENSWESCEERNGFIEITPINAATPVKFIWNTGRKQDTTNRVDGLKTGTYHSQIIDGNGCRADKDIIVDAYRLPIVAIAEKIPEKCYRSDGEITLTVNSATPSSLTYHFEGFPEPTPSPTAKGLREGTYRVIIRDSLCTIDTTFEVGFIKGPIADFEINRDTTSANSYFIMTDMSVGAINKWNWDMNDGTLLTGKIVIHSYSNTGEHKILLEVTDENGCTDTISKNIDILKLNVFIPNTFTPNGDGINDIWKPVMSEYSKEGYRLSVFDRWGQAVFQTTDTEKGWDGTMNGNPAAPNTVYAYQLIVQDYSGREYKFVGHVSLIR